jgi:lipopolysaccharide assembly protein A
MTYVSWFLRIIIFLLLLGFALENMQPVTVKYYFVFTWQTHLVVVIAAALLAGVILGLLALTGPLYRQRRQIQQLRKEVKLQAQLAPNVTPPPAPPPAEATPALPQQIT